MAEVKNPRGVSRQVLFVTLWLTLLVLAVKVWAGWATRSLSLLAESLHTVIDSFSTVLSLLAVSSPHRISGREVWGHSRLEATMALLLVSVLGFASFSLLGLSLQQLDATPHLTTILPVQMTVPLIGLLTIVFAASLGLAFFERYLAKTLESSALRVNANQIVQDAWLTLILLGGLIGILKGYRWLDPMLAIALLLTAALSCWRVFNWQLPLMIRQTAIAPEAISQLVREVQGVTQCYQIYSRGIVGRQVLIEMRLILHPEFAGLSQWIIEQIEASIRHHYGPVQVVVHLEHDRDDLPLSFEGMRSQNPSRELDWN
ncbi:MAG: cation diffusion facilitator family transporter [Leptolyngbyaceae cyanobacterium CSU_1_3]|nr:cation diffusion facilitator family transporter [Leptolyngbyaceae cyanobacterium CSU_1_3]